jgi:predicted nucleic acid-binding protein
MGKKKVVLCDTNILFELLKHNTRVKSYLEEIGNENIAFSIITHAEAYAGSSKEDLKILKSFFSKHKVYHLDRETSRIFSGLIQSNPSRHSKWIPDALIAATAISNHLEVYT